MIFPLGGLVIGAVAGALTARQRGGKRADMAQWAAVFAMIGGILGLFVMIFIMRLSA